MEKWFHEISCFSTLWFKLKEFWKVWNQQILLEILVNDLFEKCHSILGYIIISDSFGINKALLRNSEIGPMCKVS